MMSLAQRVRDFRYHKGWGPDELANRAEISRTALYQIESGKTGWPRAGTLRRIAEALEVSMEELLGHAEPSFPPHHRGAIEHPAQGRGASSRGVDQWIPEQGGPLTLPPSRTGHYATFEPSKQEEVRQGGDPQRRPSSAPENLVMREGELMLKLHDLLHSPLGTGIARIIDDLHTMIPRARNLG